MKAKSKSDSLHLYEEFVLLALRDQEGTYSTGYVEYAVVGAVISELLLDRRITIDDDRKKLINLDDLSSYGDPVIDACLKKMGESKRRARLSTWMERLSGLPQLRHMVAKQLCERGILRSDEQKILLFFSRKVYPEINPEPEKAIIERLRTVISDPNAEVDAKTAVLIALADSTEILAENLSRNEVKKHKERIKEIAKGHLCNEATKEAIESLQSAILIGALVPTLMLAAAAAAG
ncbi:MAG: GPP34 family phosphoprotein [Verrucomicrobiota bacterium]